MKKILTLALALLLMFALAAPAMAFTGTSTPASAVPYKLSVYLVDYSDSGFFGMITLPAADRGYAKNESVAAVAELFVPKGTNPGASGAYGSLTFSGTNISLNVADNSLSVSGGNTSAALKNIGLASGISTDPFTLNSSGALVRDGGANFVVNTTSDVTYKWLFFAKVLLDGGKLTVTLTDGSGVSAFIKGNSQNSTLTMVLGGVEYQVLKHMEGIPYNYGIYIPGGTYRNSFIELVTDSTGKTTGMVIRPFVTTSGITSSGPTVPLGVSTTGALGYYDGGSVLITSASQATPSGHNYYALVMAVYNDVVKGVFGLDYMRIGNYLTDSFFTSMVSANTLTASVDVRPFAPYVAVPAQAEVVVNPPKTGDAAGVLGFAMIALAVAAAVVARKVRT